MSEDGRRPRLFGGLTLAFLVLVTLSGAALGPFYAVEHASESMEALVGGLPWGSWLRGMHAWSAEGLLVCSVAHFVEIVVLSAERRLETAGWWRAVLLVPAAVAAMLGGFMLRNDDAAIAATRVARGVLETLPIGGTALATLVLGPEGTLGTVLLHHAGTFTLAVFALLLGHVRRPWPDLRSGTAALLLCIAAAGVLPPSLGPPEGVQSGSLLGPWYLLGLQGLLVDLPIQVAWILPVFFLLLLGALRFAHGRTRWLAVGVLVALLAVQAAWALRLVGRGG
jgi:hypothetical protein